MLVRPHLRVAVAGIAVILSALAPVAPVAGGRTSALATEAAPRAGTAVDGTWVGTLQYLSDRDPAFPRVSGLRLRVTRRGVTVFDRPVPLPRGCKDGCSLRAGPGSRSFELRNLRAGPGPDAVIWFWTGGAHCCTVVRVVSIPDGHAAVKSFGNPGARIVSIGGRPVFRSADDRFSYLFTSFAASGFPVRLWRYGGDRFLDVTRGYREVVAADAANWWVAVRRARSGRREVRGVFAAWAADTCALGYRATVERELAAGIARGDFSPPRTELDGPFGARYAAALRSRLRAWGYCR